MKTSILFFVLLTLTGWTFAEEPGEITNIEVSQGTEDEERVVDIQFDLIGSGDYYDVYLEASFDNGVSFTQVNPREVTGANDLTPDNNIGIVWDGRISYPEVDAAETIIRLTATRQVEDVDENYYRTVKIGDQLWMAENLRVTRYNDQYDIPAGLNNTDWENATDGAYAIYPHEGGHYDDGSIEGINSDAEMLEAYGALYNWYAVDDARGLCPDGWRVPADAEWTQLVNYVVGQGYPDEEDDTDGAGNALKSCWQENHDDGSDCDTSEHPRWDSHTTHQGFDQFGFSALPGGIRWGGSDYRPGKWSHIGSIGFWWSATEAGSDVLGRGMRYGTGDVHLRDEPEQRGFSVRCIRID